MDESAQGPLPKLSYTGPGKFGGPVADVSVGEILWASFSDDIKKSGAHVGFSLFGGSKLRETPHLISVHHYIVGNREFFEPLEELLPGKEYSYTITTANEKETGERRIFKFTTKPFKREFRKRHLFSGPPPKEQLKLLLIPKELQGDARTRLEALIHTLQKEWEENPNNKGKSFMNSDENILRPTAEELAFSVFQAEHPHEFNRLLSMIRSTPGNFVNPQEQDPILFSARKAIERHVHEEMFQKKDKEKNQNKLNLIEEKVRNRATKKVWDMVVRDFDGARLKEYSTHTNTEYGRHLADAYNRRTSIFRKAIRRMLSAEEQSGQVSIIRRLMPKIKLFGSRSSGEGAAETSGASLPDSSPMSPITNGIDAANNAFGGGAGPSVNPSNLLGSVTDGAQNITSMVRAGAFLANPYAIVIISIIVFIVIMILLIMNQHGGQGDNTNCASLVKSLAGNGDSVNNGDDIEYQLTLTDTCSGNVTVSDVMPDGTRFANKGTGTYSYDDKSKTITWNTDGNQDQKAGDKYVFDFTVHTTKQDFWVVNEAIAEFNGGEGGTGSSDNNNPSNTPPNDDNCNGHYATDIAKNYMLGKNFGDPNCTLTTAKQKNDLYDLLKKEDASHADWWFNTVIRCESSYDPNTWRDPNLIPHTPDPHGAWGLFQDGSSEPIPGGAGDGLGGQFDRGDVDWPQQVFNAVHLLPQKGTGYWASANGC